MALTNWKALKKIDAHIHILPDAVHKNLYELKKQYPVYAFADVDVRNTPQKTVEAVCQAVTDFSLDGIKLHPNNSGMAVDSDYNKAIFAFAEELQIPVAIHAYPRTDDDVSAAKRIVKIVEGDRKSVV